MNTPSEISTQEWEEIMKVSEVQNMWDIKYGDTTVDILLHYEIKKNTFK